MSYLDAITTRATASRASAIEAVRAAQDSRSGLTRLRPHIDHLEATALPALEHAKAVLAGAGIVLDLQRQYDADANPKRAAIALVARPDGTWPRNAHARSDWVEIQHGAAGTIVAARPIAERDTPAFPIEWEGDPAEAAVAHAIDILMERLEAPPKMTGAVLRVAGSRHD